MTTVGVLALQGAFARHFDALQRCGVDALEVRTASQLDVVDALVLPGGESTTISKLLVSNELGDPLADRLDQGMPVFGTCAGMILLASDVLDGRSDQRNFGAIDLAVRRNAYGRQVDSFEADLDIDGIAGGPYRAPGVERVGSAVEVLASVDDRPVLCSQGSVLVSSFHPELTEDDRLHQRFLTLFLDLAA
ncbi:MAG: pyridoxal 5'-phosphate synthase glutaminase subunit PdxT [Actinomycetota bacterium]|nr:pyridoxal 5'-phosphate synthase glutaminase subunit PdxT [Actinomycetota bacterium]